MFGGVARRPNERAQLLARARDGRTSPGRAPHPLRGLFAIVVLEPSERLGGPRWPMTLRVARLNVLIGCNTIGNIRGHLVATRTVRLDEEGERALKEVRDTTGLPISEALKRGLRSLRDEVRQGASRTAYDIYRELDHGPGGSAIAPSTETKRAVREAIKKKLGR